MRATQEGLDTNCQSSDMQSAPCSGRIACDARATDTCIFISRINAAACACGSKLVINELEMLMAITERICHSPFPHHLPRSMMHTRTAAASYQSSMPAASGSMT